MLKILCECLTVWSVPRRLQGAQVILAHAAGENSPNDPGIVNKITRSSFETLSRAQDPVIAQGSSSWPLRDSMRCSAHDRLNSAKPYEHL